MDADYVMVTCGSVCGKLLRDRFICPGIHQECIKVNDQIVTPKMFSVMGDKETLKDWKNAIRINGVSIRKMMHTGELEFHNHTEQCTGRCISRNTGVSKYDITKFDNDMELPTFVPIVTAVSNMNSDPGFSLLREMASAEAGSNQPVFPSAIPFTFPGDYPTNATTDCSLSPTTRKRKSKKKIEDKVSDLSSIVPLLSDTVNDGDLRVIASVPSQPVFPTATPISFSPVSPKTEHSLTMTIKQEVTSDREEEAENHCQDNGSLNSSMNGGDFSNNSLMDQQFSQEDVLKSLVDSDVLEDSQMFWKGIIQVGLMDDFVREIKNSIDILKNDLIKGRSTPEDCRKLSRVVTELGLMTKLKWKLAARKTETDLQKSRLMMEIETLKQRVAQSEQKQKELKRKAECFDQLIELGRPKRTPTSTPESSMSEESSSSPNTSSQAGMDRDKHVEVILQGIDCSSQDKDRDSKEKKHETEETENDKTPPGGEISSLEIKEKTVHCNKDKEEMIETNESDLVQESSEKDKWTENNNKKETRMRVSAKRTRKMRRQNSSLSARQKQHVHDLKENGTL